MTDIEEIPIESHDPPDETLASIPETPEEIQPAPKKRGRPVGAKNKAKPKPPPAPKPKAKQKKQVEYEEYTESEEEETPPPRRRVRAEQPVELDRHALASEVLGILQNQHYQRTSARRNHYASWFENLS
jgi:hypothetical protein